MKNTLKGIAIIIVSVLVLLIATPRVINLIKYHGTDDSEQYDFKFSAAEVESNYDDIPSDIEGWTMGDKWRAGLQPIEGCDSDGDGLTDKEEIEVYHSDPAKVSTAGDLYTDGYKVENGMDVNTYAERSDVTFDNNECSEVALTAGEAGDLYAHISSVDVPDVKGYNVYKAYDVYNYGNTLSIDVSDVVNTEDLSAKDLTILIGHWYGGEMWSKKQSVSDNVITPDYTFDRDNRYTVLVAKKNGIFSSSKPDLKFSLNASDGDIEYSDANFLYTMTFGFRNLFVNAKPHLYYVPTGDQKVDENTISYLLALSIYAVDGYGLDGLSDEDVQEITPIQMASLKAVTRAFPQFSLTKENPTPSFPNFLYMWSDEVILDANDYKAQAYVNEYTKSSNTGFDVTKDAFAFKNFRTEYSNGGNCAGIAYYTAKLFKDGTMPTSGAYSSNRFSNGVTDISWDISGDPENDTLTDRVISDYKTADFEKEHRNSNKILEGLTSGENEFVKMMGAYWAEINTTFDAEHHLYSIDNDTGVYSWDMIKNMEAKLDNKEILILALASNTGSGHAINIVDYKTADNGDTVYFILYDNEFPQNMHKGTFNDNFLKVTRKSCSNGVEDTFSYFYKPYSDCDYEYNSEESNAGFKYMQVMDANMNIIE